MLYTKPLLAATVLALRLGSPEPLGPVPMQLSLRTEINERAVEYLRDEVEQIFSPAGICFDWRVPAPEAQVRVILEARPKHKVIIGCSRGLHDHRLGHAIPVRRTVVLWTEQVARAAAGDWDSRHPPSIPDDKLGRALGRVLAHELGHIFLRHRDHRPKGLMKASFKHRDLSSRHRRAMRLSQQDIDKLREGVRVLLAEQRH